MAIMLNVELDSGLEVKDSYARVDSIGGSKNGLDFTLNYYVDEQSYLSGKSYVKQETFNFSPNVEGNSSNFIKQGYEYLKTLDNFQNAIDC